MDFVTSYYVNAVDKGASLASQYLNDEQLYQLNNLCDWLKKHDTTVIYSTLGAVTLGTLYLLSGSKKGPKEIKKASKPRRVKIKKEKIVKVDPIQHGKDTIAEVKKQLYEVYVPLLEQLEKDIEDENSSESPKKPVSYKESTQYRKLFLNESLLALLLKLDGVTAELRTERKAAVKELQSYLKRVDALQVSDTGANKS